VRISISAAALTLACASGPKPAHDAVVVGSQQPGRATAGERESQGYKRRSRPPSPESVSSKEPGGDSDDKQEAALLRQLEEPWSARSDKDDQIMLPLADRPNWKRVRFWGVEHFVGFRYGDDHHVLSVGFVHELPPDTPVNSEMCMRRFEQWGRPQTKPYDVKFGPFEVHHQRWRDQRLEIHAVDGQAAAGFTTARFSAAWAAYPAYPNACFVYAVAVPWRDHPELARAVRDRWVKEGFVHLEPKTSDRPVRKPKRDD
jgi:hypothetical protein